MPMYLKCKKCGIEFKAGIQMDKKSFENPTNIVVNNNEVCPKGHSNIINKSDYYFKE